MITVKQAAAKWGVSTRRVQMLCKEGRIRGAERWERTWMIPDTAVLPGASIAETPNMPMPRRSPFLDMTDLYNRPGEADACADMLMNNPEAHSLFEAGIAYRRGEIDKVYERARYFLTAHSGFYAVLGGGMLLAMCAIWRGDVTLWYEAKKHIFEAPCRDAHEREIVSLALAIIDSSVYDNKDFPEWFTRGSLEALPADSHPAAKVFYIKYLYMAAYAIASKQAELEGVKGLALMRMIPYTIEPMISQAVVDGTVVPEIYLRMSCAVAYYSAGDVKHAEEHAHKAIELALMDGLYGILAEYMRHLNRIIEDKLAKVDPDALVRVKKLAKVYTLGWSTLSGAVRNRTIATNLTVREREVAKLVAFGFSTREIASMLYIAESTVKQTVLKVVQKTGVRDRSEITKVL